MFAIAKALSVRILLVAGLIAITSLSVCQTANAQTTASNEWTWIGGSSTVDQPGVYGTKGVPSATNIPASRWRAASSTDSGGSLWLFGGADYSGLLNDLWAFNPSTNEWTWMGGNSTWGTNCCGQPGVYGTLGMPATGNSPGGRGSAAMWTDQTGNLWLFGGDGFDASGTPGYLNDLWMFSPSTNEWTWMDGSSTISSTNNGDQVGVYGTLGTPAAKNIPGGRVGETTWSDSSGNLWLFGGGGFDANGLQGILNDLWKLSPSTSEWTWMGGSKTISPKGVYGTLGTPSAMNIPGGHNSAASTTDSSGNLWLFGGVGYDAGGTEGFLNDLWMFNPSSGLWTWMSGSSKIGASCGEGGNCGQHGVYGTLGTPVATNMPGSRWGAVSWTDSSGNLWLFGGGGFDVNGTEGYLNDLWMFSPSSGLWTWMSGSNLAAAFAGCNGVCGPPGVFGTLGAPAVGNTPGGLAFVSRWTGLTGNFWLFGGADSEFDDEPSGIVYSSLWQYQPLALTSQTITFPSIAAQTALTSLTLSATATSGLPVSFTSTTPAVCTVSDTTASFLASGSCTIEAWQNGSTIYSVAPAVSQSFIVNKATPTITWPAPAPITYGTALSGAQLNASSTVAGSFAYTPALGTVLTAGAHTLSVTLTPTDTAVYMTATTTVSLTVQTTPTITWATPAAITYGTALSGTQLNASSTVAGTFAYTPALGTMLTAGVHTLSVTLTPTDTTDYATAIATVQITVSPASQTITF
jgi:N-acetylneuraminic acid mutarotase